MSEEEYALKIIKDYLLGCDEEVHWTRYNEGNKNWDGPVRAMVRCSDTFVWASADGEVIQPEDIDDLIEFSREGERRGCFGGDLIWVCKKRNHHPMPQYLGKEESEWKKWLNEVVPNPEKIARTWWKKDETPV